MDNQDIESGTMLETLVSALQENVTTLADRMRLENDAVVINQCNEDAESQYQYGKYQIRCYHMNERGVGRSRNAALDHARGQYCLFADDDIVYRPGYAADILRAFEENPRADILLFNVRQSEGRQTYHNKNKGRVHWYNYGRYPAYAIAAKTKVLQQSGVRFSLLYGGGAPYSNGEDSLFLHDCLKKGLKLYRSEVLIGEESAGESTWFEGYTEKFFFDRGVLYHDLYGSLAYPFGLRFLYKNRKSFEEEMPLRACKKLLKEGIRHARLSHADGADGVGSGTDAG